MVIALVALVCFVAGVFAGMFNRACACRRSYSAGVSAQADADANAHGYSSPALLAKLSGGRPAWVLVDRQFSPTRERPELPRQR